MKKNCFMAVLVAVMLFAAGCNEQTENTNADWQPPRRGETTFPELTPEPTPTNIPEEKKPEAEATKAPIPTEGAEPVVTLGQYMGLVITKVSKAEIQAEVQSILENYAEYPEVDRAAQMGDTLDITYTLEVDGVMQTDEPAQNSVTIGEGGYIPGFEDGLIGAKTGDLVVLNLNFPDPYIVNPELAGKAALFTITVDSVMETKLPELTDEFVSENFGYETAAAYLKELEEVMNKQSLRDQLLEGILENCEVEEYPMERVTAEKEAFVDFYLTYAEYYGSFYDLNTETALQVFFGFDSTDALEELGEVYAYDLVKKDLVLNAIAKKQNLTLSDEEYEARLQQYVIDYGYEAVEDFLLDYDEEEVDLSIFYDYVLDWCMDYAIVYNAEN